ncbi:uncharacterized protein RHO17_026394 isoform 1-T1 [Thomomys bottae]
MGNLCCCCEGSCCSDITIFPRSSRQKQQVTKIHVRPINSPWSTEEINEGLPQVPMEELARDKSMNKTQPIAKLNSEAKEHCPSESSCSDNSTIKEELLKILMSTESLYLESIDSSEGFSELEEDEEFHQGLQANQAEPELAPDVREKEYEDKRTDSSPATHKNDTDSLYLEDLEFEE